MTQLHLMKIIFSQYNKKIDNFQWFKKEALKIPMI